MEKIGRGVVIVKRTIEERIDTEMIKEEIPIEDHTEIMVITTEGNKEKIKVKETIKETGYLRTQKKHKGNSTRSSDNFRRVEAKSDLKKESFK